MSMIYSFKGHIIFYTLLNTGYQGFTNPGGLGVSAPNIFIKT